MYQFDNVFNENCTNLEIYNKCFKGLINNALKGIN